MSHTFLTIEELAQIRLNLRRAYDYEEAFKGLMIWTRYAECLENLARDNVRLMTEIHAYREQEEQREIAKRRLHGRKTISEKCPSDD